MKKIIFIYLLIIAVLSANAQADKSDSFKSRESNQSQNQNNTVTATLKSSGRLFGNKDDLTSVLLIIPSGSVVSVLGSDSTYLHVVYQDSEGYIYRKQAVIDKTGAAVQANQPVNDVQAVQDQPDSRYTALENKYGSAMAARIYTGKIWKGMNSEMVHDSWGAAQKINRVVSGNTIKEEWIYRSTWLYFENNTLLKWGPVNQ